MGSTRLPGKVLRPILGRPMLSYIVERLRAVPGIASVVIATSDRPGDEPVRAFCAAESIACFAGSETDVLDRFYRAAVREGGDPLLRITGDCPLVDPELITRLLAMYNSGQGTTLPSRPAPAPFFSREAGSPTVSTRNASASPRSSGRGVKRPARRTAST